MKKRNIAARLGAVALVLTLVTTSLTSGTLAKYVASEEATGTAYVAAFDFKAYNTGLGSGETKTWTDEFNLTANNYINYAAVKGSNQEDKKKVLAPGAEGTIPIAIDIGNSDVAVDVKIEMQVPVGSVFPTNMQQGVATTSTGAIAGEWAAFPTPNNAIWTPIYTVTLSPTEAQKDRFIKWQWPYQQGANAAAVASNDAVDTAFGEAASEDREPTIKLRVTATQVNPAVTPAP